MPVQLSHTAHSARIYDPHYGFYVKKLTPDAGIPVPGKIRGAVWTPVYTAAGQEKKLAEQLQRQEIPTYYPIGRSGVQKNIPLFPRLVFAALDAEKMAFIQNLLLVAEVAELPQREMAKLIFADITFMSMAERISRFYPFSAEDKPLPSPAAGQAMPLTINGLGDCRIVSNDKQEEVQIFFTFQSVKKVLRFDLALYQFRSLLLSKILFPTGC